MQFLRLVEAVAAVSSIAGILSLVGKSLNRISALPSFPRLRSRLARNQEVHAATQQPDSDPGRVGPISRVLQNLLPI